MKREEAKRIVDSSKKIYSRAELKELNINDNMVRSLINEGYLNRIRQGIYTTNQVELDMEYLLQLKYNKCIISHESALYYHGYSDRVPENISVTVPEHYGTSRLKGKNLRIRYCKPDLIKNGVVEITSSYGNPIMVYNLERTICDIIRHYSSVDIEIANKAIRQYCSTNSKKLSLLMLYAKKMGIAEKVRKRLEVLL